MRIVPLSSLKSGYVPLLNVITEPSLNVIVNVVLDIVTSLPPVGASLKDSSDKVAVAARTPPRPNACDPVSESSASEARTEWVRGDNGHLQLLPGCGIPRQRMCTEADSLSIVRKGYVRKRP